MSTVAEVRIAAQAARRAKAAATTHVHVSPRPGAITIEGQGAEA